MDKRKTVIAMSGGVDSSVAAALAVQRGDSCIGVTLKLFENEDVGEEPEKACCSLSSAEDARSVAFRLGIPFYVFNFADRFRSEVMDRFVRAYQAGRTPNPCIDCNRYLKFERLFERLREIGFDTIVTGHYARVVQDGQTGRYLLKKGLDANKDQSYVLYTLTQEQLAHVDFPLGYYRKAEVRAMAEEKGFLNAHKKESQDICFVPDGDYAGFIERYTGMIPEQGDFVDKEGCVLGKHKGIIHYTIGQRRGLAVPAASRLYVCRIDTAANQVVLGDNKDLFTCGLTAGEVNLIDRDSLEEPAALSAKIRYRHPEQPCTAWQTGDGKLHVHFENPVRAITPGQAVVLYDGDTVVGGGVIEEME